METFASIRHYFAIVGITASKHYEFYMKTTMVFVMYSMNLTINCVYLFRDANDFEEIVNLIYVISTHLVGIMTFTTIIWTMENMFTFLDKLEKLISNSKLNNSNSTLFFSYFSFIFCIIGFKNSISKTIYMDTDRKMQKKIEILSLIFMKVSPACLMLPQFLISFFNYFFTSLGNDAFEMPYPVWYDK